MGKKRRLDVKSPKSESTRADDWLSALVKKTTASEASVTAPKQLRVEKRRAKKQRRDERKPTKTEPITGLQSKHEEGNTPIGLKTTLKRISEVASVIQNCVDSHAQCRRPYQENASTTGSSYKKRNWEATSIQPRHKDYGGIGLARPSLFLEMEDPSFSARLSEEFNEHVPGFFGKQRTKAMKKQLNSKMLWKKMSTMKNVKVDGRKLADLPPDERVEAMIKAGML